MLTMLKVPNHVIHITCLGCQRIYSEPILWLNILIIMKEHCTTIFYQLSILSMADMFILHWLVRVIIVFILLQTKRCGAALVQEWKIMENTISLFILIKMIPCL